MSTTQFVLAVSALCSLAVMSACSKKQRPEIHSPAGQQSKRGEAKPSSNNGVEVSGVDQDGGEVELSPIYFEYDSFEISLQYRDTLARIAQWMTRTPGMQLTIEGHCDDRGTDEYNIALGERRALAIRDYLQRLGVDQSRISIISYGEERPAAEGNSEDAWARNRRGELRQH